MPASLPAKVKNELDVARSVFRPTHLQQRLETLARDLRDTIERVGATEVRADDFRSEIVPVLTELSEHTAMLTRVVDATNTWSMIERSTQWAAIASLTDQPTISIVMPTHNRSRLLRSAVSSVQAQSYDRWQLVIVDDGSTDDTPDVIAELRSSDDRVISTRTDGLGPAGARNAGLDAVDGSIVTFLDDDNAMMPHWLRGIAEFSGRVPSWQALYGAQLRAPLDAAQQAATDVLFVPIFDEQRLRRDNYIDLGALAVRAGHPALHFAAECDGLEDWDLAVRLAESAPLIALPVLASCYSYSAADRVSTARNDDAAIAAMRARFAR